MLGLQTARKWRQQWIGSSYDDGGASKYQKFLTITGMSFDGVSEFLTITKITDWSCLPDVYVNKRHVNMMCLCRLGRATTDSSVLGVLNIVSYACVRGVGNVYRLFS